MIAQDESQNAALMGVREKVPTAIASGNATQVLKYDVSVPIKYMDDVISVARQGLDASQYKNQACVYGYGHLADGNVHLNVVVPPQVYEEVKQVVDNVVYPFVSGKQGSISAEHGIGIYKLSKIHYSKSPLEYNMMKQVKQLFDPKCIMNRGKLFEFDGSTIAE